jgi:hypothetical protein
MPAGHLRKSHSSQVLGSRILTEALFRNVHRFCQSAFRPLSSGLAPVVSVTAVHLRKSHSSQVLGCRILTETRSETVGHCGQFAFRAL